MSGTVRSAFERFLALGLRKQFEMSHAGVKVGKTAIAWADVAALEVARGDFKSGTRRVVIRTKSHNQVSLPILLLREGGPISPQAADRLGQLVKVAMERGLEVAEQLRQLPISHPGVKRVFRPE